MLKLLQTKHYVIAGISLAAILTIYSQYKLRQIEKQEKLELQTQLAQMSKDFKVMHTDLTSQLVQAKNEQQQSQEALIKTLSEEYQQKLKDQKMQILAKLDGVIAIRIKSIKDQLAETQPGFYSYMKSSGLIDRLTVDTRLKPAEFDLAFKPQTLNLSGTLNFDKNKYEKDQKGTSFWMEASNAKTNGGLEVTIPQLNFTPAPEFNQWVTQLRTKSEGPKPLILPKYSIDLILGHELFNTSPKIVYGVESTWFLPGGFNVGAGVMTGGTGGTTIFGKIGFRFGKWGN